ncbi:MAG TPA: NUDIX domain-containing protein [Flavitalea sp.]|nr:NUDIX domain-containing protein [Flavitalea sp.]
MRLKIYFEDKPLFLTDSVDEEIGFYRHHDDAIFMDELSSAAVNAMIHEMKRPHIHAGIYLYPDLAALRKAFFKKFIPITAAGGVVFNDKEQVLLIHRRNKWDLPKGKLEPGESIEACAIREVQEETGLEKLAVDKFLLTTFHVYEERGKHILKDTHWYRMTAHGQQSVTPQQEEEITRIVWTDTATLPDYTRHAYTLIAETLDAALS